jgi:hypothetical protein
MSWAIVFASVFNLKNKHKLFFPAVLLLGILPDIDLFLGSYGVYHHTFFHSIFFWFIFFLPAMISLGWKLVVPYFAALLQHFVFGDFLVGDVMLFWPFDYGFFGFNSNMLSVYDVVLEITGLVLAFVVLYYRNDLKSLLYVNLRNIFMVFPLLALVSSMIYFTVDWPVIPLVNYVGSSSVLTAIVIGHLILVGLLSISAFQGLRKLNFWMIH